VMTLDFSIIMVFCCSSARQRVPKMLSQSALPLEVRGLRTVARPASLGRKE
jgi:hypothetical protein